MEKFKIVIKGKTDGNNVEMNTNIKGNLDVCANAMSAALVKLILDNEGCTKKQFLENMKSMYEQMLEEIKKEGK